MSACVLDASSVFPWLFADEASSEAHALLAVIAEYGAVVPALWYLEIANGLLMAERRNRLTSSQVQEAVGLLAMLPLVMDEPTPERAFGILLDLMRTHRLTAYDATYLEIALRSGLPLASGDRALRDAAASTGVVLLGHKT